MHGGYQYTMILLMIYCLMGSLTIPEGEGPFPVVLLLSGAGLQDRDETVYGHKPFKVLADHLTCKGIAALRVDDRGVGGSTGNPVGATPDTYASDALSGVKYLMARPDTRYLFNLNPLPPAQQLPLLPKLSKLERRSSL